MKTLDIQSRPIQTFPLVPGESYRVLPPPRRLPGVVYLSGVARLLEVTASGQARFESAKGACFLVALSDNRIFRF